MHKHTSTCMYLQFRICKTRSWKGNKPQHSHGASGSFLGDSGGTSHWCFWSAQQLFGVNPQQHWSKLIKKSAAICESYWYWTFSYVKMALIQFTGDLEYRWGKNPGGDLPTILLLHPTPVNHQEMPRQKSGPGPPRNWAPHGFFRLGVLKIPIQGGGPRFYTWVPKAREIWMFLD